MDEGGKKEERVKDEEKAGKESNCCIALILIASIIDGGEQRVAQMPVFGENLSEKVRMTIMSPIISA